MADEDLDTGTTDDVTSTTETDQTADTTDQTTDGEKTALESGGEGLDTTAPQDWPDDWRAKLAGEDADALKSLERYKSPQEVAKALREAQKKISSTKALPEAPGKDATEEEVAAYRKELGVPDKPEGYLDNLPDGLVIGDDDKPLFESLAQAAHEANIPPQHVGTMLDWYHRTQEATLAEQQQGDKEYLNKSVDELRSEWGSEYKANMNAAKNFMEAAPTLDDGTSIKDLVFGARLADGSLAGNNPAFLRWIVQMANDANPAGFTAPGDGTSQAKSVGDEISEIETVMRTDRARYNKDPAMQKRLQTLYAAQEKLGGKAA